MDDDDGRRRLLLLLLLHKVQYLSLVEDSPGHTDGQTD